MPERIPQSTTIRVPLYAVLTSDHVSAATGKTVAITISKNGAAFGNPSAGATNATEIASGWYYVDLSTTDTGTLGPVIVRGAVATIDDSTIAYNVVVDPPTANATQLAGQTITAAAGVTFPTSVASPTNITAGTITTVTNLTNAATAGDLTATMKTSVTTAATAATPTAAAVTAAVTLTSGERNSVADALLDRANAIEVGLTVRSAFMAISAMLFGKVTGAQTGTEVFREAVADAKARVTITDDSSGNRSAVTTDFT